MSAPRVSVLVPVHNGGRYLAECLDSILEQDFRDYELLISDDGSTDGSPALIERYAQADGRIRWWRNPRNLGIGANFNACLKAARGEFVKYMLQDDKFLERSALRRMVEALASDASVSLVASASQLIDEESRPILLRNGFGSSGIWDGERAIVKYLEHGANLIGEPSLVLFRKSQASRGFDEGLQQMLDLEMWFHLLEQGRFAYIAEPLCAFRQHSGQFTQVNRRTGIAVGECVALLQQCLARPSVDEFVPQKALFKLAYYSRKRPEPAFVTLGEETARRLGRATYARLWVWHKLTCPLMNLQRSVRKRYAAWTRLK